MPSLRSDAELLPDRIIFHKDGLIIVLVRDRFYFHLIFEVARSTARQEYPLEPRARADIHIRIHVRCEVDSVTFEHAEQIVGGEAAGPTYLYDLAGYATIFPDGRYVEQLKQGRKRLADRMQKCSDFRSDDVSRKQVVWNDVDQEMSNVIWLKTSHVQYGVRKHDRFAYRGAQLFGDIETITG